MKINPNDAIAFFNRGAAYHAKGNYDRAVRDYDRAIKLDPNFAEPLNNRGLAYEKKGQFDRAIQDYNEAIRLHPNYAQAFINRGNAYFSKLQYDRAVQDYDQAIQLNPNYSDAFASRGMAYSLKGEYDRAIHDYDRAIRLNPNDAQTFYNRGAIYGRKGQFDRAIQDYSEAIRLNPRDADAFKYRGIAKQKNGDIAGGNADIAKARQLAKHQTKRVQLLLLVPLFVASVAIGAYLQSPNTLSVLAAFGVIVFAFRVCMALVVRKATAVAVERESLFAMMVPISGIFWMGSYKHPSVPWPDMLGIGLSHLGYTLGAAAVVAGHFNILGLHRRSSTIAAALAFFIAGTVLANVDALASAPWVFFPFLFIVSVIFLVIGVVPAASGKISSYFSTVRDVRRFKRLIEEVSAEETVDRSVKTLHAVWTGERTKEDALKEFAALLITLKRIAAVLERYGYAGTAAKAKLIDLYWALIRNQAGLRVGTTYIPAAALYDPNLLALLLEAEADGANIAITAFDYCAGKPRRR